VRRRKVTYPVRPGTPGGPTADERAAAAASRTVSINLQAMTGRPEIKVGSRVRITSGLYAGELAVVESVVGGVIPAAVVRTDAARSRRARTVDLIPVTAAEEAAASGSSAASAPAAASGPGEATT
jgi:hypothetical protein